MKYPLVMTILAGSLLSFSNVSLAQNTITFDGEVTDQTCEVSVAGSTSPVILLASVPKSTLDGGIGTTGGETTFTISLSGCTAPTGPESYQTRFIAVNPNSGGRLANTDATGPTNVSFEVLDGPGGAPLSFSAGAVSAGSIDVAATETTGSAVYGVRYYAEAATVDLGPVISALMYTVRYE